MPGCAPSTPASHEPSVVFSLPFSYSFVSSPRYQRFPSASCAYQSYVSSRNLAVLGDDVVDDSRLDADDRLRRIRDGDDDAPDCAFRVGLAEHAAASRNHREVGIVDLGRELGRVELHGLASLRKGGRSRADCGCGRGVAGGPGASSAAGGSRCNQEPCGDGQNQIAHVNLLGEAHGNPPQMSGS